MGLFGGFGGMAPLTTPNPRPVGQTYNLLQKPAFYTGSILLAPRLINFKILKENLVNCQRCVDPEDTSLPMRCRPLVGFGGGGLSQGAVLALGNRRRGTLVGIVELAEPSSQTQNLGNC